MKSKTLSKQDREDILDSVEAAAKVKWDKSLLADEVAEIVTKCGDIIKTEQLRLIPADHRNILNLYGGRIQTQTNRFSTGDDGGIYESWNHKGTQVGGSLNCLVYSQYGPNPEGYPWSFGIIKFIHKTDPTLLPRLLELQEARKCEVNEVVKAHRVILDTCNTTTQAYKQPWLRPHLPKRLTTPPAPRVTPDTSEAERFIKQYNAE